MRTVPMPLTLAALAVSPAARGQTATSGGQGGFEVTAFEVDHGEKTAPAFGHHIEAGGRPVVITGDTKPEESGTVFSRTGPKLAVYYHPVDFGNPKIKPYTMDELVAPTRKTHARPLVVGRDPMTFGLSDGKVTVVSK